MLFKGLAHTTLKSKSIGQASRLQTHVEVDDAILRQNFSLRNLCFCSKTFQLMGGMDSPLLKANWIKILTTSTKYLTAIPRLVLD